MAVANPRLIAEITAEVERRQPPSRKPKRPERYS